MNTLEYSNNIFELFTRWGIKWYLVFVNGVNTVKLSSLLKHISFLIKHICNLYTKIYNALYWKVWLAGLFQVFANESLITSSSQLFVKCKI